MSAEATTTPDPAAVRVPSLREEREAAREAVWVSDIRDRTDYAETPFWRQVTTRTPPGWKTRGGGGGGDDHVEMAVFGISTTGMIVLAARFGGGYTGFASIGMALAVAAAVAVLVLIVKLRPARLAGGRYVQVHGHAHGSRSGQRQKIAKHEAGHAVAARALGGQVKSATLYAGNSGGLVQARVPNARAEVAFLLAGQYAVNSSDGASGDNAAIRKTMREFPSKDRARVMAQAKRDARRIVNQRGGEIRRDAARLNENGRL